MWIGVGMVWMSVSATVCTGLYLTHNANCLWAFLIPALISWKTGGRKRKDEDDE